MTSKNDNKLLSQSFLEKYFIEFLITEGASKKTQKNYLYDLQSFFQWLIKDYQWDSITVTALSAVSSAQIESFADYLKTINKDATVTRHISAIKSFYQALIKAELVSKNPVARFQELSKSGLSTQYLPLTEWQKAQMNQGNTQLEIQRETEHIEDFLIWIKRYKSI